jgi:predicted Kef-type K+ transport protein
MLKMMGLIIPIIILGKWIIPTFFKKIELTHSKELCTLSILVLALGFAVVTSQFFDVDVFR